MTIEEFNQKYTISCLVQAIQPITLNHLTLGNEPINYDAVDEVIETINYAVYHKISGDEELLVEGDNEEYFMEQLIETFNLKL